MAVGGVLSVPAFVPSALAASNVGTWERDPERGLVHCDAVMARLYGLDERTAADGVSLARLREAIHPDDRAVFSNKLQGRADRGGLMVIEYRVLHPTDGLRWMLVRGRYDPIRPGDPIAGGRGIAIDITESKLDGHVEDQAFFERVIHDPVEQGGDELQPHHRAADWAVALKGEAVVLGGETPGLGPAVDLVLLILARRLAEDVAPDSDQ